MPTGGGGWGCLFFQRLARWTARKRAPRVRGRLRSPLSVYSCVDKCGLYSYCFARSRLTICAMLAILARIQFALVTRPATGRTALSPADRPLHEAIHPPPTLVMTLQPARYNMGRCEPRLCGRFGRSGIVVSALRLSYSWRLYVAKGELL